jgi:hypothetical protein
VNGASFVRRGIRSKSDEALKLMQDDKSKTALAFVSPNFYFRNKDSLKLTVLAEAQRKGLNGEQYVLIGKTKAEKYPEGKKIATNLDDTDWLNKVVMPAPDGAKAVEWVQKKNIFDELFAILDGEGAADFVLVDRITLEAVDKDADLKKMPRGLQSAMLPQELVVELDARLGDKRDAIIKAFKDLDASEEGKKVGEAIQVPKFMDADESRVKAASEKFNKAAK